MKKITQFSVNYPVTILMMVLAVVLLGYISFTRLGVDLFPEIKSPQLFIEISAGEKSPEEIENLFVQNIEAQAIRQSDVVEVASTTEVGSAKITVTYAWNKDMDEAYLDLQKALSVYSQNSDIEEITISEYDPNDAPVMIIAMENSSIDDLDAMRKTAENYVRNKLMRLEGIADVKIVGDETAEVVIETSSYKLDAYGLTAATVAAKIKSYNQNVSGGTIEEKGTSYSVKGLSMIEDAADLENIVVGYYTEGKQGAMYRETPIFLKEVADVKILNKDPENIVRYNGKQCLGLSVYKEPRFNTSKAVENVISELEVIENALPSYNFTVVKNQGTFINAAINDVGDSAILGIVFAIIIIFVFLKRISTTLVIAIAIPISFVATFMLMYFQDLTLNMMTLGGLALGAGMLVDNAIIVIENIYRHLEKGKTIVNAAIEGTAEVGGAIMASTITTVVVFLPIVYMHGASGELFKDQALTVAFSLLSSLVVAILVIPVLMTKVFPSKKSNQVKSLNSIGFKWYTPLLEKILKARWTVIAISIALVVASYFMVDKVGSEFMPNAATNSFTIEVSLPEGTSLSRTSSTLNQIETIIHDGYSDYVSSVYAEVGSDFESGSSTTSDENTAIIYVQLNDVGFDNYQSLITSISEYLSTNEDIQFSFKQDETSLSALMGNEGAPLIVEIQGEEIDEISELTEQIRTEIAKIEGLYNVETSTENGAPEIDIKIDRVRAGIYDISTDDVITQISNRLEGTSAGSYDQNGELTDITIRQKKVSVAELNDLEITSGNKSYRLSDFSTISIEQLPRQIMRRNQTRIGQITAYTPEDIPFDHTVAQVRKQLENISLPKNYKIEITGEEVQRKESMENLTFALLLSILLVYMVMAAQFESLIHPFTILLSIPLALVGAVITFFLLGTPFNIMAYIGMIMLVGIAVNDSIILVDAINQNRSQGIKRTDAILLAGQQRIRPIIMTSLTTILALIPMTLSFGGSTALKAPMAWAVIGGLTTSTLLTLVLIPCIYTVFSRKDKISDTAVSSNITA